VAVSDFAPNPEKPVASPSGRNLLLRVVSALVLAPIAIGANYLGGWYAVVFWAIATIGVWWEWTNLISAAERRIIFSVGSIAILFAAAVGGLGRTRTPIFIIGLGALALGVLARSTQRLWIVSGLVYAGGLLIAPLVLIADAKYSFRALAFVLVVVWMTDIFAYFGGRLMGGPKLAPAISPNKTWSGAISGTAAAILTGIGVGVVFALPTYWPLALIAFLLSVASHAGDLFESRLKRIFGVKDSGHLIPGHGGLMDRLDGFVFAVILAALIGILHEGVQNAAQGLLIW
jgi:phosphatidate cytidylyltransferase